MFIIFLGFAVGTMSFDKDGVRTAAVMAEMANKIYGSGSLLSKHLESLYNKYGHFTMYTRYFFCEQLDTLHNVFKDIRTMNNGTYPSNIGNYKIQYIRDLTTGNYKISKI